jgi:hypothetical protein
MWLLRDGWNINQMITTTGCLNILMNCKYSRRRLMGSRIMGSIGLWAHFYPDQKVTNFSSIPNFYFDPNSLIGINRLLESICLCPKAIPLNGFHCRYNEIRSRLITLPVIRLSASTVYTINLKIIVDFKKIYIFKANIISIKKQKYLVSQK